MAENIPPQYDIESYHFDLPMDRIAQHPANTRDQSRLLSLDIASGTFRDLDFRDIINFFTPGDLIVVNNTKVFPARLLGRKETGGRVELLILHYPHSISPSGNGIREVEVMGLLKGSKSFKPGQKILFTQNFFAEVMEIFAAGKARVRLFFHGELEHLLETHGHLPLPPYIRRNDGEKSNDRERYQTVYASQTGAIAAPTAGLHFTQELLTILKDKGIALESVTLHVGYGTFAPVRVRDIRQHQIHSEFLTVSAETAEKINTVRSAGGRVWAVGTTTVRALEFAADDSGRVQPTEGWCNLYIYPGYHFKVVRNLITNFHLPSSSLLFMVSALAGKEKILKAYQHAIIHGYRFFSYGDAMIICGD